MADAEVTLIAELTLSSPIRPEDLAALEAVVEKTRAEPGCLGYTAHAHAEDPCRVLILEFWADQGALDRHWATEHLAAFREYAASRVVGPPALNFWRRLG